MKSVLFAYYDKQLGCYSNPTTIQGLDGEALKTSVIRAVKGGTLKMPNMDVMDLYHLGYYEDEDGSFELFPKPKFLIALCEFMPKVAPVQTEVSTDGIQKEASN